MSKRWGKKKNKFLKPSCPQISHNLHWADERTMPHVLLRLLILSLPNLPVDLRRELWWSEQEFEDRGVVTYPTKARVKYYLWQHQENVAELDKKLEKTEGLRNES